MFEIPEFSFFFFTLVMEQALKPEGWGIWWGVQEDNEQYTHFPQEDSTVQTGELETHRWPDINKRSIMKL